MSIAYLDSSALAKLAILEDETPALEAYLANSEGVITSRLSVVELSRASKRIHHRSILQHVGDVLDLCVLAEISPNIAEVAAALQPAVLRSLDAIHLATALAGEDPDLEMVTYDDRLGDAARQHGLKVVSPGRVKRRKR